MTDSITAMSDALDLRITALAPNGKGSCTSGTLPVCVDGALPDETVSVQLPQQVVQSLAPQPTDHMADLYCGIGNFTLPLAGRAGQVIAVDRNPSLLARARANARRNGLENIQCHRLDLVNSLQNVLKPIASCTKMIIDPPRQGAIGLLRCLPALPRLQTLAYIACDINNFVRDAAYLARHAGWRLAAVGIIDMFAQTTHVEIQALFKREGVGA
jgi:23S rRNA (uracil1939-C5)-methyltransferase